MKIDRLIGILSILLQKEKVTAPYLAEKFEVSRRTINRDIEALCKAGIPLITVQGTHGGIYIAEGYKMDKTLLTSREMQEIITALKSLDSISGHNRYKQLIDKFCVTSSLSDQVVYDVSGHIRIDLASHYKESLAPKIELIQSAIEDRRIISFDYFCNTGESKRKIEPYLVVFQWSSWYVWGFCIDKEEFRLFKLNRLLYLQLLQETFIKRDLPSFEKQIEDAFQSNIHLVVKIDRIMKWKLVDEFGIDSFNVLETGELLFEFDFTNKQYLLGWLLGFGDCAKIIEPIDIRTEYLQLINKIYLKYQET